MTGIIKETVKRESQETIKNLAKWVFNGAVYAFALWGAFALVALYSRF